MGSLEVDRRGGLPQRSGATQDRPLVDLNLVTPARSAAILFVHRGRAAVTAALAFHAVRSAIEMGADKVATDLDDPSLTHVGFRRSDGDRHVVRWNDAQAPNIQSIEAIA